MANNEDDKLMLTWLPNEIKKWVNNFYRNVGTYDCNQMTGIPPISLRASPTNKYARKTYAHSFFRAHNNEILPMLFTHSNTNSLLYKQITSSTRLLWPMHNKTVCSRNIFNLCNRTEGNSTWLALEDRFLSCPFQLQVSWNVLIVGGWSTIRLFYWLIDWLITHSTTYIILSIFVINGDGWWMVSSIRTPLGKCNTILKLIHHIFPIYKLSYANVSFLEGAKIKRLFTYPLYSLQIAWFFLPIELLPSSLASHLGFDKDPPPFVVEWSL